MLTTHHSVNQKSGSDPVCLLLIGGFFLFLQHVAKQMLEAVAYMHEVGLVHTDLKPENILLVAQDHMKLPAVAPAT